MRSSGLLGDVACVLCRFRSLRSRFRGQVGLDRVLDMKQPVAIDCPGSDRNICYARPRRDGKSWEPMKVGSSEVADTEPVPTSPTVAERIRQLLPTLPAAERRVARVVLANYPVAGLETIARLARRSGTSGPTVLRLATRLGIGGFSELQQVLRDELDARERSPLIAYSSQPELGDDLPATAAAMLGQAVTSSVSGVERTDFDQAIDLIMTPKARVSTTGGRFSGVIAEYLAAHLQQLRSGVSVVRMADRVPSLLDLTRRDVLVVFDFRRYQADVVNFGRAAVERGAQLVLITDPWMSPLSTVARVVLTAEVAAPSPFDSLVPCMALVETLVAGIVAVQGDAPRGRIAQYDEYWANQYEGLHSRKATDETDPVAPAGT